MANLNVATARKELPQVGPYGNMQAKAKSWTGDAAQNDVVYMFWIPAESYVHRVTADFTALGASVTADIGYIKMDSNDDMTADDDAFTASPADVSAAAQVSFADAAGVYIEDDAFITVTLAGANPDSGTIDILVEYRNERK